VETASVLAASQADLQGSFASGIAGGTGERAPLLLKPPGADAQQQLVLELAAVHQPAHQPAMQRASQHGLAAGTVRAGQGAPSGGFAAAAGVASGSWWLHSDTLRLRWRDIALNTDDDGELVLLGRGVSANVSRGVCAGGTILYCYAIVIVACRGHAGVSR
jgi:hypothetical protein